MQDLKHPDTKELYSEDKSSAALFEKEVRLKRMGLRYIHDKDHGLAKSSKPTAISR